jgi:homogentisate phytyltransferase/homogentisate geranylgeranyltransferase
VLQLVQDGFRELSILWRFSRPHTIIGTTLSIIGLAAIALGEAKGTLQLVFSPNLSGMSQITLLMFGALIPSLCANIYIVGLNQLEDIEIDRINKSSLPLVSEELSQRQGVIIVSITGIVALLLSALQGYFLFLTVLLSELIGTAYSLPPIRLKRFPFWAALCIFGVRGLIVNLGFFLHFQQRFSYTNPSIPAQVWLLTGFVILFAFAIAIFKDIPDAKGDRQFKIRTLTLRLGIPTVFNLARWVLTTCYGLIIVIALWGKLPVQSMGLVVPHLALLSWLWLRSWRVNLSHHQELAQFYQFIWKLFFLEYLIFPAACLWHQAPS